MFMQISYGQLHVNSKLSFTPVFTIFYDKNIDIELKHLKCRNLRDHSRLYGANASDKKTVFTATNKKHCQSVIVALDAQAQSTVRN